MSEKIKITHVTRFAKPHNGGIESFIEMFNSCVKDDNTEIEVFCCSNTDKSSVENCVKYHRCKYLIDFAANSISPQLFFRLMFLKTDVIIFHMPVIQNVIIWFILYHLGLLCYKKMIITYHSDIVGYDKIMKPFWKIYKYFLSKADVIHVQSPQMIEYSMVKNFKEKTVMIPYLINTTTVFNRENVEKIKNKFNGKKIIFAIGRHVKYKGFEYLIEAMKSIDDAVLLLGSIGPLTEKYKNYVNENKLQDKVLFLGRIPTEDLESYYEACDIFVLPSTLPSETFAVVQLEAMKHSKPVINTQLGTGVNYVSIDKETGLTVEPKNIEQLAQALNKLLNDDNLRCQLGQNARKRVENLFDIDKVKTKYNKFYKGDFSEKYTD